jgi:hypothetical protein
MADAVVALVTVTAAATVLTAMADAVVALVTVTAAATVLTAMADAVVALVTVTAAAASMTLDAATPSSPSGAEARGLKPSIGYSGLMGQMTS